MANPKNVVPMLMKAFQLLEVFREHPVGVAYPELLTLLPGISRVSTYRILCSLVAAGYMYRDPRTTRYHLGAKFIELDRVTERQQDVLVRTRPFLEAFVDEFGETANVGRIENGELVCLTTLEGTHRLRVGALANGRMAIYSSALGKAILAAMPSEEQDAILDELQFERLTSSTVASRRDLRAQLAATARRGYALDKEETLLGVRSVGVAVRDLHGYPVAAISITGPASRLPESRLREAGRFMSAVVHDVFGNEIPTSEQIRAARV